MGKSYDFGVAVIGGGPAGYVAAIRAAQLGARVALVEKGHLGGVCTNVGCIPTKALIHTARTIIELRQASEVGVDAGEVKLNFARTARHRDDVIAKLRKGVETLLAAHKVELVRAHAAFEDEHTLSLKAEGKQAAQKLSAERIFIAAGAESAELPMAPFDGESVIDSSVAVLLDKLPQSLLILGAGYIGCEFAGAFSGFGVEVTVVEVMDRILPQMDADCAREVFKLLKKGGVRILTGTRLEELKAQKSGVKARLSGGDEVKADKALICVGRRANCAALALDKAGVKTDAKGVIVVNQHLQTSVPHIYAIGDVKGGIQLAHVASEEGLVAAAHATGKLTAVMDYRVVPAVAFTFPEIAYVGMTEEQARKQAGEIVVKRFPLRALGRAHIEAHTDGFVKMIAEAKTGQLLGVHIAAQRASDLIGEACLALKLQATAEELAHTIHAHPTMPECMREAAEGIIGMPINWTG
jgi:dihydrolipoamide dehydrogenase